MIFPMPEKYGNYIDCSDIEMQQAPMFYRASPEFVFKLGTEAQKEFVRQAKDLVEQYGEFKYCSVDTRSHMLMPGMTPCIPGWHCDDFHRPNGQPDIANLPRMMHVVCSWGFPSPMEYQNQPLDLPVITEVFDGETIYGRYDKILNSIDFRTNTTTNGFPLVMRGDCFHRGTEAKTAGWRMFARATFSDHRFPKDLLRRQTQVYMSDTGAGW